MESQKLILLPGLGGDERLLEPQRVAFPDLIVPRWLTPEPRESLPEYAARMAVRLIDDGTISLGEWVVLGGVSFGGMLALEMARHVRAKAVILIGSCRSGEAIASELRAMYLLWRWLPLTFWRPRRWTMPLIMGSRRAANDPRYADFIAAMLETPPEFLKWACGAILAWRPAAMPDVPIIQVHGLDDRLIPSKKLRPWTDMTLLRGGHLINISFAIFVNRIINDVLNSEPGAISTFLDVPLVRGQ